MDEQLLKDLLDRDAIQQARLRFAEGLDHQDWDLVKSIFLDEVEADFSVMGVPAQRVPKEAVVDSFRHNLSRPGLKTQHLFTNFRITIQGDTARCKFNQLAQHYIQGFEGGEEFYLRAEYDDTFMRRADGWKLSTIKLSAIFYTAGNPNILAQ